MAVIHLCDRCGRRLDDTGQLGMFSGFKRGWKFWKATEVLPEFKDIMQFNTYELHLCKLCTTEFFTFVKSRPKRVGGLDGRN